MTSNCKAKQVEKEKEEDLADRTVANDLIKVHTSVVAKENV